jgi:hypothetical protein
VGFCFALMWRQPGLGFFDQDTPDGQRHLAAHDLAVDALDGSFAVRFMGHKTLKAGVLLRFTSDAPATEVRFRHPGDLLPFGRNHPPRRVGRRSQVHVDTS